MIVNTQNLTFSLINNDELLRFVKKIWLNNFDGNGFGYIVNNIFNNLPNSKTFEEVINIIEENFNDKEFKRFNRKSRKNPKNLNEFGWKLLEHYLGDSSSYLDYGCGRMALIRRIVREEVEGLKRIYGFEPKADMRYFGLEGKAEFLTEVDEVRKLKDIDLININYVLHHLTKDEIKEALKVCKEVLSENGKVVILEESFYESLDLYEEGLAARGESSNLEKSSFRAPPSPPNYIQNLGYIQNTELNTEFEKLSVETKKQIIFLNDILMNYKNLSYMPWTMEYQSIEEWGEIFEENGLKIEQNLQLGFVKGAKAKGGTTTVFILEKV